MYILYYGFCIAEWAETQKFSKENGIPYHPMDQWEHVNNYPTASMWIVPGTITE